MFEWLKKLFGKKDEEQEDAVAPMQDTAPSRTCCRPLLGLPPMEELKKRVGPTITCLASMSGEESCVEELKGILGFEMKYKPESDDLAERDIDLYVTVNEFDRDVVEKMLKAKTLTLKFFHETEKDPVVWTMSCGHMQLTKYTTFAGVMAPIEQRIYFKGKSRFFEPWNPVMLKHSETIEDDWFTKLLDKHVSKEDLD